MSSLGGNDSGSLASPSDITDAIDTFESANQPFLFNGGRTCIVSGCKLSEGTLNTYDISSGVLAVFDKSTTPANPTFQLVSYLGETGITITNLLTQDFTYIAIDPGTALSQQFNSPFTVDQSLDIGVVGVIDHKGGSVEVVSHFKANVLSGMQEYVYEIMDAFGGLSPINNRIVYSASSVEAPPGNFLGLDHTAGEILQSGGGYADADPIAALRRPNAFITASQAQIFFEYRWQGFTVFPAASAVQQVDPGTYDDGTGTPLVKPTGTVNPNQWQIQRIFNVPGLSGRTVLQYGQNLYSSEANALAAISQIGGDSFVQDQGLINLGAMLRGFLVIRGGATDIQPGMGDATIVEADTFGVGATGVNVALLQGRQDVYEQGTTIATTALLGAVVDQGGSGTDTDLVRTVKNNAGAVTHSIAADGKEKVGADATQPASLSIQDDLATGPQLDARGVTSGNNGINLAPTVQSTGASQIIRGAGIFEPVVNVGNLHGMNNNVIVDNSTANITNLNSNFLRGTLNAGYTGIVTTLAGTNINTPVINGGTITNVIGIKVQAQAGGVTNKAIETAGGFVDFSGSDSVGLPEYTVAMLPTAVGRQGFMVAVSDDATVGYTHAISNGAVWRVPGSMITVS